MSSMKYWLWFSTAAKLPVRVKNELLSFYQSPENIFNAPRGELRKIAGDREGIDVLEKRDMTSAFRIMDKCKRQGIDIITVQDAIYPDRLKNVYSPPSVLYVKGKFPTIDDEAAIAVVGTRNATEYGIRMGHKLGYEIVKCGGIVLSGLTRGIDISGAEGALSANGVCIGVLGVPHELAKGSIYERITEQGALISEYPPGTESSRFFFRARNRITAGLSVGVVVVEAPEKSGSLLFTAEAAEQGKEIFAVPGNADSENSAGTIRLLKDGAKPVACGWDILCELAPRFSDKLSIFPSRETAPLLVAEPAPAPMKTEEEKEKKEIDKTEPTVYIDLKTQLEGLSEVQLRIVSAIEGPSAHVDDIIEKSGIPSAQVLAELTMLQIKGYVIQEKGKRFRLNI